MGIKDPRGKLFLDYIRIVREKRPKFFVIENVKGILEDKHKETLNGFLSLLCKAGYNITYELLNAADYKIPQNRFRVFFIGIRSDLKNSFHFPNAATTIPITLRQAIGDITEEPAEYNDKSEVDVNLQRVNHDVYIGNFDSKYMSRNRVRSWDELSFTMQAQARNAPMHPQAPKMIYISSSLRGFVKGYEHLYRRLSVRECARIQTFPDKFKFLYSNIKDGYKMVGNAVPPRLAWYIARQLKVAFGEDDFVNKKLENHCFSNLNYLVVAQYAVKYPQKIINKPLLVNQIGSDPSEIVLVGLIPHENISGYLDKSAKIYYTGKKFPLSIQLDKLCCFIPYIKGKGIRDLYVIKIIRIGSKGEFNPRCSADDFRIIFEVEYYCQLFHEYIPIHLNIWHTFTVQTLGNINKLKEREEFV